MGEVNRSRLRVVREDRPSRGQAANESALLHKASLGDEQAFGQLYDLLAPSVFGIVLRVVKDRAMAEEVAQEVFVDLWKLATRFDSGKGSVRAWSATIAHRRAVDRVRTEQSRRDREDRDHQRTPSRPLDDVVASVEQGVAQGEIHQALDALTAKQREAVTMAYFGGHTYHEVAALLDVPEGTIKTRIRDGLIKLRDNIARIQ